jgi:hypothetical protein
MIAAILAESTGSAAPNGGAAASPRGVPGDGGPDGIRQPSGPSSRLGELKHERAQLSSRLGRMLAARDELGAPARALDDIDAERRAAEVDIAGALSAWAQGGCDGHRPVPNAALASPVSPAAGKRLGPH